MALRPSRPTADRFDFLAAFHESALGGLDLAPIIARRLRDQKAMLVEPKCHMTPFGHGKGRLESAGDRQRQAGRRISRSDWRSSSTSRAIEESNWSRGGGRICALIGSQRLRALSQAQKQRPRTKEHAYIRRYYHVSRPYKATVP
jgi:hypothetical protein